MAKLTDYVRKEIIEIILYLFIVVFFGLVLPLTAGFSFKGFEESISSGLLDLSDYLGTFLIYLFFLIPALFLVIYPITSLLVIKKGEHPATQPNPKWYRIFTVSLIFNPEDGMLSQISKAIGYEGENNLMRWSKNILRVLVIGIIIFGTYGILQTINPSLNVVGVPSEKPLAQQITVGSDIIFGSAIPSIAENGLLLFVFFLLLGIDAYLCAKLIKDKILALFIFFTIAILVISPLMATGWMSYHSIVYGNSEASLKATWLFGYLGCVMTLLFGIFLFFLLFHFFNNLFIKLVKAIAFKEDIIFITALALGILLFLWITLEILLYIRRRKKKNKTEFAD